MHKAFILAVPVPICHHLFVWQLMTGPKVTINEVEIHYLQHNVVPGRNLKIEIYLFLFHIKSNVEIL